MFNNLITKVNKFKLNCQLPTSNWKPAGSRQPADVSRHFNWSTTEGVPQNVPKAV